jgi:proline iminopeptidase
MSAIALALTLTNFRVGSQSSIDHDYHEKLNGTELHFRVRGKDSRNPYLLILHGGPGFSGHMFYPWGESLEQKLNVVYLDQRGCGESQSIKPEDVAGYTVPAMLADLEEVRVFLHQKTWFVLGHSWGGMLGLEYVLAHPESIRGYIHVDGLVSQPMTQNGILNFSEKQIRADEASTEADRQASAKRLKPYIPYARGLSPGLPKLFSTNQFAFSFGKEMYYADPELGERYRAKINASLKSYNLSPSVLGPRQEPTTALEKSYGYSTKDLFPRLSAIRTKTLVINGKQDSVITVEQAKLASRGIPNSKLVILDRCGHFPFAEQPNALTRLVLRFAH